MGRGRPHDAPRQADRPVRTLIPDRRAHRIEGRGSYIDYLAGARSTSEFRHGLESVGLAEISVTPTHADVDATVSAFVKRTKAGET